MQLRARLSRVAFASALAFAAVLAAVYFLVDNRRAAGAVTIVVVVVLAAYLAFGGSRPLRGSIQPIVIGTALATSVGLVAFALAILLVAVTTPG